MAQPRSTTNQQSRFSKLYVVAWALLGLAALVYVSALYARPHWLASPFGRPASEQESNKGTRSLSKAMAELEALQRNEKVLQREIGLLRAAKARAATAARTKASAPRSLAAEQIATRFSGDGTLRDTSNREAGAAPKVQAKAYWPSQPIHLARAADQAVASADTSSPPARAALAGVRMISRTATGGSETDRSDAQAKAASPLKATKLALPAGKPARKPEAQRKIAAPKVDAFSDVANIETGSIAAPGAAIGFGPAVVKRSKAPPVGVHLASGPSLASLRLSWLLLNDRHGTTLGKLKPRYRALGPNGARRYRLVAGPLPSTTDAVMLCKQLRLEDIKCTVASYRGKRF